MAFTTKEKIDEIGRELRQRANVYPRLIKDGRLKQSSADLQLAILREILQDYEAIARTEAGAGEQGSLI